ncbi:helix-turn-helix domain-containing protein [Streptomyces sp. NPDC059092]|uniref:helix-turn-helix domain-containing protein n=1 Tax=Streptomyces sp. NPDC059092 TaxID=3346725 RepID=UPI00369F47EC
MSMDLSGADRATSTDDSGWEPEDAADDSGAVIAAVGRQIKLWRQGAGLRQAEFGAAIGYCENQVYKVEAGKRIPKPEFLERADEVLDAGGKIAAMKQDVVEARYPKRVRDLAKLEGETVELGAYSNHNLFGLLQTEEYARALFRMRRPLFKDEVIERLVAARLARQKILTPAVPVPVFSFVQEEVTLRRPLGGKMVHRRQLEHLLLMGQLRNVEIQVMPTELEDHAGMGGEIQLLKLGSGATLGYLEAQRYRRLISDPVEVQSLEIQYGIIRAQALTPRESLTFIENLLGET